MYVNALYDKDNDVIHVVERVAGERVFKEFKPNHTFYIKDQKGTHTSIFGDSLVKITPTSFKDKQRLLKMYRHRQTFESDINLVNRCLEENYKNSTPSNLHVAFFDIETDFCKDRGYSSPQEAFNPITSIAVYLQWIDTMVCLAVPPKTLTMEEAKKIADEVGDVLICNNEKEMLQAFITLIQDADVVSGWNSEFYDIPYTVNRITHLFGKNELRKLCLWDEMPVKRTVERGGTKTTVWDLVGRIHIDYLQLYKNYTYEERHSYALDAIAEHELGEKKVEYEGTLDQLYNDDFKKFLEYNIQDTMLIDKLDKKLKYIELGDIIAHNANMLLPSVMGAVAITEAAIVAEAHERGVIVMDKKHDNDQDTRAAGGWVQNPKKGLHKWIGSIDLNSLYPSVIRALNMSPETIVGQIRLTKTLTEIENYLAAAKKHSFAEWWNDRFNVLEMEDVYAKDNGVKYIVDFETGDSVELTGREINELVFSQPWCISANGTIFRTDVDGIIPGLLSKWYADRKNMKSILKTLIELRTGEVKTELVSNSDLTGGQKLPDLKHIEYGELERIHSIIKQANKEELIEYLNKYDLEVKDGAIFVKEENLPEWKEAEEYWDKRQLVRKINLNSLYGGLLNKHCRFFDQRLGQSTTLTGRTIARHMAAKTNELIAGEYNETGKAVIYGDSVTGDTIIETNRGPMTIEELYNQCDTFESVGEKQYGFDSDIRVASYDKMYNRAYYGNINYVYRHKVQKHMFEIEDEFGNKVTVTEDHSIMVKRNGDLVEVKPLDITDNDIIISLHIDKTITFKEDKVKSVKEVMYEEPIYVYDLSMSNVHNRWFFGNNILVHNTDSCTADSIIETSQGAMTIEQLFNSCSAKYTEHTTQKEYAMDDDVMVMSYDKERDEPYMGHINYVYRHPVSKDLYEIEDEYGNTVTVTEDHSIMVERNGNLVEVKPQDIADGDIVLCLDIKK